MAFGDRRAVAGDAWISVSTSVFQAPQCGHCPCHLSVWPPHSLQLYTVFVFAIRYCNSTTGTRGANAQSSS